ncbi:MAG: PAS domain S-box protein [bacterium]|nr:PAS domain S-box protein [bacterium]
MSTSGIRENKRDASSPPTPAEGRTSTEGAAQTVPASRVEGPGISRVPRYPRWLPVLILLGGILHAVTQAGNHLLLISDMHQEFLLVVSLALVFAPALYALRRSMTNTTIRYLAVSGVLCKVIHLSLDVADDLPAVNGYWLFNNANAVHIILQEAFGAAAVALLLSCLYYFVVSHQRSEALLAIERDLLRDEAAVRRNAEIAQQHEREFTSATLDSLPGILYLLDKHSRLIRWNRNAEVVLGYTGEELSRLSPTEFFTEDARGDVTQAIQTAFAEGSASLEAPMLSKTGTVRPYLLTGQRVTIGGEEFVLGTGLDIGKRVAAEETLRRHSEALEQAMDGIAIADLDGVLQFVNPAWAAMHGYSPKELEGLHLSVCHTKEQMEKEVLPFNEFLKQQESHSGEIGHLTRAGVEFRTWMSTSIVKDAKGRPVSMVGIARDITRERKLEAQVRHAQKMEAIGTLAGGIAHNLRNNLGAILGWIEIAAGSKADPERVSAALKRATRSGMQAADHVKRLLTFSRTMDGQRRPLRIGPVVEEGLQLLKGVLPSTIRLQHRIDVGDAYIQADPDQIHQVLINLGTNAIDAMKETGGTLSVTIEPAAVTAEQAAVYVGMSPGDHVRLNVRDTGHGMAPNVQDHVFDPFFTTKEPGSGTGLGMSVVHGIVEALEGVIEVNSAQGEGTSFTMFFPICPKPVGPEPETSTSADYSAVRGRGLVLLVDDDEWFLDMTKTGLELLGYSVEAFAAGADALSAFRATPDRFDVVLTDEVMPGMKGTAVAAEMTRVRPEIPIILLSGLTEAVDRSKAQAVGVRDVIVKPVTPLALAETLEHVLPDGSQRS